MTTRRATRMAGSAALVVLGASVAAAGIAVGEADDAPGAALIGLLLLAAAITMAIRRMRRKE